MWSLMIRSPDEDPREYDLKPNINTLGRNKDNHVYISDESASRYHAEIDFDEGNNTLKIFDLDSTNGTYVNGKKIREKKYLEHEDQIRVGLQLITVISREQQAQDGLATGLSSYSMSRDFLIESIEHYAVILHDVGAQLNTNSDLNTALLNVSESIKYMVGADVCQIFLADRFDQLEERGIPAAITDEVFSTRSATMIPNVSMDPVLSESGTLQDIHSLLFVPVMKDGEITALIYANRSQSSPHPFTRHDLALLVAMSHPISLSVQRKEAEEKLLHDSNHDPLTNLPNRILYLDRLTQLIARSKRREDYSFAVLFIDLDNFKLINDSLGHIVGDKLLIEVGHRLRQSLREEDTLARFGGDEFAVLADDIEGLQPILTLAERIQENLSGPFDISDKPVYITTSIGIALNTMEYDQPEDILRNADIAMYRAKEFGKAGFAVYDQTMHEDLIESMHLQTARREAVNRDELLLHYQPIVSVKTGQVVGFEALLRWESPDQGLIFPDKFFSTTDTTGLLNKIDIWVLRSACEQMSKWIEQYPTDPPLHVAVNLSSKQINHPNLVDQIIETLEETGLEANNLWLEIVESANLKSRKTTLEKLSKLREIGVNLSLDDFGTGFSSLSYLHEFPINALKIDRSFISRIGESVDGSQITQTITTLATVLKMISIAEGVETVEQLDFLRSVGCDYVQGFLVSKPITPDEVLDFLAKEPYW